LQQNAQMIFPSSTGQPLVRTLNADGSASYAAVANATLVSYTSSTYNQTLVNGAIAGMRTFVAGLDYGACQGETSESHRFSWKTPT
jgi:hypothetical protein